MGQMGFLVLRYGKHHLTAVLSPTIHSSMAQAWASTSRKARDALRRASLDIVHALEVRLNAISEPLPYSLLSFRAMVQTPSSPFPRSFAQSRQAQPD